MGLTDKTVRKWRDRFDSEGLTGLQDRRSPGLTVRDGQRRPRLGASSNRHGGGRGGRPDGLAPDPLERLKPRRLLSRKQYPALAALADRKILREIVSVFELRPIRPGAVGRELGDQDIVGV